MAKVIVERPRLRNPPRGQGSPYPRARLAHLFESELEDAPSKLGMARAHREKWLNENLAPLARFLRGQVGRPWDRVRAEISERIRRTSTVQAHVLQHLSDFVIEQVTMVGGKPHELRHGKLRPIVKNRWQRAQLWVCPRSGILREARRVQTSDAVFGPSIRLDGKHELRQVNGRWLHVTLAPIPQAHLANAFDVLLEQSLSPQWFGPTERYRRLFGRADTYAVTVREPGVREMERARSLEKSRSPRTRS